MDKILKFLKKLDSQELEVVETVMSALIRNQITTYNIKKLRGHSDVFRIRVGTIRIIFRKRNTTVHVLDIGRRSEKTYKDL